MKTLLTIVLILTGLLLGVAFFVNSMRAQPSAPAAIATTTQTAQTQPQVEAPTTAPGTTAAAATAPAPANLTGLYAVGADEARVPTLGSLDPATGYKLEADLSAWGASILNVALTDYTLSASNATPYVVQRALLNPDATRTEYLYPFAARAVTVNGQRVSLADVAWGLREPSVFRTTFAKPAAPGSAPAAAFSKAVYAVTIVDGAGLPVLEIVRTYSLAPGSYQIRCEHRLINKTAGPLTVEWEQFGQADVPNDDAAYLGDHRNLAAGYFDVNYDPKRDHVFTKGAFLGRLKVLDGDPFWPNGDVPGGSELVWAAATNRYFAAALHRPLDAGGKVLPLDALFQPPAMVIHGQPGKAQNDHRILLLTLTSKALTVPANGQGVLDLSLYTGPRDRKVFANPPYDEAGLELHHLLVYSLGCTFCTFQPLARFLLWFLRLIEGDIIHVGGVGIGLHDWGIAIIVLVIVVRLILHPITKRSQIGMMKMSKGMAAMQPEIEKLKKKYKDDQASLNREMMALYREKGVNPANVLGCLPMFLQMPIWVALYAMLYFAIELRSQPAFYGIFQFISGGHWPFLADLSSPDRFIPFFAEPRVINLMFITLDYSSINLLPILMGVVFYYQQKLMTPPAANEQQAQQQKIMKYMTLLFPVMLYSAPSGLTLYIMASTLAGIVDSLIVKRHIKREEEAGTLFKKKQPPKPGSMMEKLQKFADEKQRQIMDSQQKRKD